MADDYQHRSPEARLAEAILAGVHAIDWDHPVSNDSTHKRFVFLCGFEGAPPTVSYRVSAEGATCQECIKKLKERP